MAGFEDLIRIRIAGEVGKAFRQIDLDVLSSWLDLRGDPLVKFVTTVCGWKVGGNTNATAGKISGQVLIPANAENEAKSETKSERVGVEMFGRVFRRGFEAPA